MNDQFWWYATRAAGLMTWATAMASIALGLMLSFSRAPSGPSRRWWRRLPAKPWLLDLHRFVGGLSVCFLVIHLVTLWADSYVHFGLAELLVPGASAWRPLAVAWGVVAAWLLVAIEMSSLVKNHLPPRLWRGVHLGAYLVAVLGTVHAITAGSDVGHPLIVIPGSILIGIVVGLTVVRLASLRSNPGEGRRAADLDKARALLRDQQSTGDRRRSNPGVTPIPRPPENLRERLLESQAARQRING